MSKELEVILAQHQLRQIDTPRNGDCFFHALKMMLGHTDDVKTMRLKVVENMKRLFGKNVENQGLVNGSNVFGGTMLFDDLLDRSRYTTWDAYFVKMSMPGEWADDPCIWSAVLLYDVKITVYVSDGTVRVFDKLNSWGLGTTSRSISIGNWTQRHFVAIGVLNAPGVPQSKTSKTDIDDQLEDLDMQMNTSVNIISLKDMYEHTYREAQSFEDVRMDYDTANLVGALSKKHVHLKAFDILYRKEGVERDSDTAEKKAGRAKIRKTVMGFLRDLQGDFVQKRLGEVGRKVANMVEKDYKLSGMTGEKYKEKLNDYFSYARDLIVSYFSEAPEVEMVVDMAKRGRLLRIIQMAIKIGLNYQMLSEFNVKFLPEQYEFDDEDYDTYFADRIVEEDYRKVKVSDLATSPYWEGIRVVPDMGDYVSVQSLGSDQLVNMVKRTTLYKIYQVSKDYRLNLDDASPSALKTLCSLKTLELAPDVHEGACRYFEGGMDWMEDLYTAWLNSNKSFKPYRKSVEDTSTFITVPDIPYSAETTVNEVMDDLSLLPGLIQYRKHDDHENEIRKNGDLFLVNVPSDAEFAMELSQQFVELGFLPEGYERYCGVKVGEVRAKRSASGMESPSKRPRERLFTAVETY